MGSLILRVFAVVLSLSLWMAAPVVVRADDDDPETKVEGRVSNSGLAGLAVGDKVDVEWKPVVGARVKIENDTQDREIKCRITSVDPAPSHTVVCANSITTSEVPGIAVGTTLSVEINFSPVTIGTSCGATPPKQACLRFTPSGFSVLVGITEKIEADTGD